MAQSDKILVALALLCGVLDALELKVPLLARFSPAGLGVILLAVVMLHRGGVLNY
jgi:hypothetical protein